MVNIKYIIYLFALLFISSVFSCTGNSDSIVVENWKINKKQDISPASVSAESGWKDIEIPSAFRLPDAAEKSFNYVWLKGEFLITGDPSMYTGLSTGRVRLADIIYINNITVGSVSETDVNWNPVPRNYTIPAGVLKKGKNILMMRLGIYGQEFGGISDCVYIQQKDEFFVSRFFNDLIYKLLPFGIIILYIGFVIQSLISFFWNRKEQLYVYFSLILIILAFFIFMNLPVFKLMRFELFHAFRIACLINCSVLLLLIVQSMYRLYFSNYNRIIVPCLILFSAIILISCDSEYFRTLTYVLGGLNHAVLILYFGFIILRMNAISRENPRRPDRVIHYSIAASLVLCGLVIVLETYFNLTGGHCSGFVVTYVPPVGVIFISIYMARGIMRREMELRILYDKLKNAGEEEKDVSLTDAAEEKLNRVIAFIDENYKEDISREGLAAAVGLNPSYMGTLFKSYKGITIKDYINQHRINEAIEKLKSGNNLIIDIAFSVGFENIVSFNRVFKRVTGKTPSEYKSSN